MNTLAIVTNAPDKATHVAITDNAIVYIKSAMVYDHLFDYAWRNGEWVRHQVEDCRKAGYEISSLSDIRRIVELEKEVKKWQKWHSETSQTLSEVCGKAEAAERERDDEVNKVQSLIEKRAERAGSHARENFITFMKFRVGGSSINHIVLMISDRLVNQQYESDHVATVINELLKLVSERAKEKSVDENLQNITDILSFMEREL